MSLPCLYTSYLLLYLSTCSASEFVYSHLYTCQPISRASRFVIIRCIPHPSPFIQSALQDRYFPLKNHKWLLWKIWLTGDVLGIHLPVYTAGSRGQALFSCTLLRSCHWKCCHCQPRYNAIGRKTLLRLGGKLASRGWGLHSSWQEKQCWNNQLRLCLQTPKGYLETPVQTQIVYTSDVSCNGWFSLANSTSQGSVLVLAAKFCSMRNKVHDLNLEAGWFLRDLFLISWKYFQTFHLKQGMHYHFLLRKVHKKIITKDDTKSWQENLY